MLHQLKLVMMMITMDAADDGNNNVFVICAGTHALTAGETENAPSSY